VSDVVFLILYVVIGYAVARVCLWAAYRRADAWPPAGLERFEATNLVGEEIGYMAGIKIRAIQAAVARLRVAEAVTYDPDTTLLFPTGASVPGSTDLSTAVLAAAAGGAPIGRVANDTRVEAAPADIHVRLHRVQPSDQMPPPWYFLRAGLPLVVLVVIGVGWALIPPLRWYTDIALTVAAIVVAVWSGQLRSWACALPSIGLWPRVLRRVEERNGHLHPRMSPTLTTYGPAAAVAVGLFGTEVLRSVDPALAVLSVGPDGAA
jgi:hypothetical protein